MLITQARQTPAAATERGAIAVSQSTTSPWRSLIPVAVDVAVPLGAYYVLRDGFGTSLLSALIVSSLVPAVRSVYAAVRERQVNGLALLMLAVNLAGIALSFVSGSARVLLAKDSGISSVIAIGIVYSSLRGRSVMTAGLKPFLTKGNEAREAAWDRLAAGSSEFVRLERRFGLIWGGALLAECLMRLVCAFTVAVPTMTGWLSTVILVGAIAVAIVVSGGAASDPMEKLVQAEAVRAGA